MKEEYVLVGMRVEQYVGEAVSGHNCNFSYTPETRTREVLLLVQPHTNKKFELTLWTTDGECGSGWCTATFGNSELREVELFACKTHTCKPLPVCEDFEKDFVLRDESGIVIAESDYFGGCQYYPGGSAYANVGWFTEGGVIDDVAVRKFTKRPVLIFYGDSNTCKSHIAALTGKTVFETDSVDTIPHDITEDIIVIGNRHGYDLDDVRWNIYDSNNVSIIEVNFKHSTVA